VRVYQFRHLGTEGGRYLSALPSHVNCERGAGRKAFRRECPPVGPAL